MGINEGIADLRVKILNALNESPYPIEVKRLVLSEIYTNVSRASVQTIREEKAKGESSHGEEA